MNQKKTKKDSNVRLTGAGPVTGEQYLMLQQKLSVELGDYQALLGITMKEHYLITLDPAAPLNDPGLCLHLRLLDEYPELVVPDPRVNDLVEFVKQIKRDYPETDLPMSPSANLVGLMLGRRGTAASHWNTGRARPTRKTMALVRHLITLLDERHDPDRVLAHYCALVEREAKSRGVADIFTERRWP
ncbi:MAG TPA: hypothetical protein PKY50_19395 [Candidatus Competibacter sp.]|nr:hypothetical protein [Candidatus Competibacter sp.]